MAALYTHVSLFICSNLLGTDTVRIVIHHNPAVTAVDPLSVHFLLNTGTSEMNLQLQNGENA